MTMNLKQGRFDLDELVNEHLVPLRAFLASMSVHSSLIDDVAQDVFLEALNNIDRYDDQRSFRAWLFGIAKNLVYQEFRKHARDRRLREGMTSQVLARFTGEEIKSPDEIWMKKERVKALNNCISRLPEKAEYLINLRFNNGLKSYEISEKVGMKAAAVRMSLMRIRHTLRDCIENKLLGKVLG